ncbi:MAG: isoprenylcysteine carboxylmethyltransferase family protein [Proteobacteria bacterium]|nr:isoprenylcysteine carboxylmethyltransferase family protein [Pseudomonadota bacterium]
MTNTSPQTSEPYTWNKVIARDLLERTIIFTIFGLFAVRTFHKLSATQDLRFYLLLLSEVVPVTFLLLRRPSPTLSDRPSDWLIGVSGSIAPLLITPSPALPWVPSIVCYIIIISGICVQLSAKIILGLSFGIIAANRGVKHEGPYRFVRHPMYAGYTMAHIGLLLAMPVAINAFWYGIAFLLQIARMNREERVLKQSQEYRDLMKRVPYRLVPGIY